jgi:transposase-like protein
MAGQARLTVGQIDNALRASSGNVAHTARQLGVSRSTLYRRINESSTLQEALADAREELVDIAESALRQEIESGNITAIIFTLKTLGKGRGYVERQQHEHSGSLGVQMTWRDVVEQARQEITDDD